MHLDARRLELPHQLMVVCRDHDRGSEPVQLDEQAQKATRHLRVDVAGRLVREQHLWLADDGARDGCPLLLPTRQFKRPYRNCPRSKFVHDSRSFRWGSHDRVLTFIGTDPVLPSRSVFDHPKLG